ncbi:MAG: hypothetical protein JO097_07675, partial [Acidobacteriaceae bacterium]|nr:hypothetical protein [Acidobacteriaceae bacterium]
TAEAYGAGDNEQLVRRALAPIRNKVVIATKFLMREPLPGVQLAHEIQRIDSSDLLPVRDRCLTKMLPVQTWHEREQEAEASEFGDQARVGGIGGGEVRVGNAG